MSTEYINSKTKILFKCNKCEYIYDRTLMSSRQMKTCTNCSGKIKSKYNYEFVKDYFEKENCRLISTEYKNSISKLQYECKNKHLTETIFSTFLIGHR